MCVLPHGGAWPALLSPAGDQDLQQTQTKEEVNDSGKRKLQETRVDGGWRDNLRVGPARLKLPGFGVEKLGQGCHPISVKSDLFENCQSQGFSPDLSLGTAGSRLLRRVPHLNRIPSAPMDGRVHPKCVFDWDQVVYFAGGTDENSSLGAEPFNRFQSLLLYLLRGTVR